MEGGEPVSRVTHLNRVQTQRLQDWARVVRGTFRDSHGPFLVGSAMERADWHDVDVRVIMPDDQYDDLAAIIDVDRLGIAFGLWGQETTGLPIDFQIQRMTEANERFPGAGRRNALGIGPHTAEGDGGPR